MSWTAIWTDGGPVVARAAPRDDAGDATFLVEGRASRSRAGPQTVWRGHGDGALALGRDPDGAIMVGHGGFAVRTDAGAVEPGDRFRLTYRTGRAAGAGVIEVKNLDRDVTLALPAGPGRPLRLADVTPRGALGDGFAGLAALANHNAPCGDRAGLETGTMVATPAGEVAVETLKPGAVVLDDAGRFANVTAAEAREAVTLGSMPAIRMRAPYFGLATDLCLTHRTQVVLSGPEVEYTFGTETVLARAADLVNGTSVLRDMTVPVRTFHRVELATGGCLRIGRARIAGTEAGERPVIDRAAAQSLLAMRRDSRALIG
ncbi:hypothetical protein HKCCE2091_13020 [Rhodobacterales bacterium HKCCE2091]|nr:hypothetical protein [Rhodobacterales bacterium HKCCE2091]